MSQRESFYGFADLDIDTSDMGFNEIIETIIEFLDNFEKKNDDKLLYP